MLNYFIRLHVGEQIFTEPDRITTKVHLTITLIVTTEYLLMQGKKQIKMYGRTGLL